MATAKWSPKDPQDVRDYWIDARKFGLAADETLTVAVVTVPDDQADPVNPYELLSAVSSAIANPDPSDTAGDDKWVVVRFAGGSPMKYPIHYGIDTSTGQHFDFDKTLEVKERIIP